MLERERERALIFGLLILFKPKQLQVQRGWTHLILIKLMYLGRLFYSKFISSFQILTKRLGIVPFLNSVYNLKIKSQNYGKK